MEVNNNITKSLESLVKDKIQGLILTKSMFEFQYEHDKNEYNKINLKDDEIDLMVKNDCSQSLAKYIIDNKKPIEKTKIDIKGVYKYNKRLIVLEYKELKEVVEYCIRTMPEQAIKDIRNI